MCVTRYRVCNGSVYEWNKDAYAYVYIGKLQGRTLKQFIGDICVNSHEYTHEEVQL